MLLKERKLYMRQLLLNPNGFAKTKAGGHFLFFGQIVLTLIKCSNVALAHNVCAMISTGI